MRTALGLALLLALALVLRYAALLLCLPDLRSRLGQCTRITLGVLDDDAVEGLDVLQGPPHEHRVGHALPVVREGPHPGRRGCHGAQFGEVLALQPDRDRAHRVDIHPAGVLAEARRLLRPGGRVALHEFTAAPGLARDREALDDLASTLQAVARADADRVTAAAADWDGFTRGWFDHHHAEAALALRQAARQAARAAVAVRQAAIATGATP